MPLLVNSWPHVPGQRSSSTTLSSSPSSPARTDSSICATLRNCEALLEFPVGRSAPPPRRAADSSKRPATVHVLLLEPDTSRAQVRPPNDRVRYAHPLEFDHEFLDGVTCSGHSGAAMFVSFVALPARRRVLCRRLRSWSVRSACCCSSSARVQLMCYSRRAWALSRSAWRVSWLVAVLGGCRVLGWLRCGRVRRRAVSVRPASSASAVSRLAACAASSDMLAWHQNPAVRATRRSPADVPAASLVRAASRSRMCPFAPRAQPPPR